MKLVISTILFSALAFGQSFTGSLRGRVVDPAGAGTPGARVTITDEATNIPRSTVSSQEGEYEFFAVTPATYTLLIEATGFKRLERKGVVVSTQENFTLDVGIDIGQAWEQDNEPAGR